MQRYILAFWVRVLEKITSPFICHYFLAEKCYRTELTFLNNKFTILENKYKSILPQEGPEEKGKSAGINFLFTGTLSENYGIFQAIDFVKKFHSYRPGSQLKIMGRCAIPTTLKKIRDSIKGHNYIELIGGAELVPHTEIIKAIKQADFGLVSYQPDKTNKDKIPTKLFEYMALQLPIILQNHQPWVEFCLPYQSALPIDFNHINIIEINNNLNNMSFYPDGISGDLFWESEENKLLETVEDCLKDV
jgi:glycosyltransferase involved in cell wall biosynthesis